MSNTSAFVILGTAVSVDATFEIVARNFQAKSVKLHFI
jgi:hypothetical protein